MRATECCIEGCEFKYPYRPTSKETLKSLFQAPKEGTGEREKWEKVVNKNIKESFRNCDKLFVCNEHFEEDCFYKGTISILVDGVYKECPRKRLHLKPNSVPTKFPKKLPPSNNVPIVNSEQSIPTLNNISETSPPENIPCANDLGTNFGLVENPIPVRATIEEDFLNDALIDSLQEEQIAKYSQNMANFLDFERSKNSVDVNISNKESDYDLEKLLEDWRNCELVYTQCWRYMEVPETGIEFVFYSNLENALLRGILVKHDMTVKAMARGKLVSYQPTLHKITCIKGLLSVLQEISMLQVCEGTTLKICPIGLYKRKSRSKCNRCADCQNKYKSINWNLKKKLQKPSFYDKKIKVQMELNETLHEQVAKSSKELAKLEETISELEYKIEKLQGKSAAANKNVINYAYIKCFKTE